MREHTLATRCTVEKMATSIQTYNSCEIWAGNHFFIMLNCFTTDIHAYEINRSIWLGLHVPTNGTTSGYTHFKRKDVPRYTTLCTAINHPTAYHSTTFRKYTTCWRKPFSINTYGETEMPVFRRAYGRYDRVRCSDNFNHKKVIISGYNSWVFIFFLF